MSATDLDGAIRSLPKRPWTIEDVPILTTALGGSIKPKERARLASFLDESWRNWSDTGRRAIEAISHHAAPDLQATSFTFEGARETGIREQSSLTFHSKEQGFLIIGDETARVYQFPMDGGGKKKVRADDGQFNGLEGSAFDEDENSFLVVSEDSRRIFEMPVTTSGGELSLGTAQELGKLPKVGRTANKGWEGIDILPGRFTGDGKPRLLAVHEGDPRAIGVFHRHSLELEYLIELPEEMSPDPTDLSDIAVHKKTGRVFLLSQESAGVYEVELRRTDKMIGAGPPLPKWSIVPISSFELPKKHRDMRAEGLALDHQGDLWVNGEVGEQLLHFKRN